MNEYHAYSHQTHISRLTLLGIFSRLFVNAQGDSFCGKGEYDKAIEKCNEAIAIAENIKIKTEKKHEEQLEKLNKPTLIIKENEQKGIAKQVNKTVLIKTLEEQEKKEIIDTIEKHDTRIKNLELLISKITEGQVPQVNSLIEELKIQSTILQDSGTVDLAEVKNGFKNLENQSPELFTYCKTFYWTTLNLFCTYQLLSIDLMVKNINKEGSTKETILVKGVEEVASYGTNFVKGVPLVGSVIKVLDSAIDYVYKAIKTNRVENKITSINKIIQSKFGLEEDISLNIAKVALVITEAKKEAILYPKPVNISKLKANIQWLQNKFEDIKDKILPSAKLDDKNIDAVKLALQDVTLLIAYLCTNYERIINEKKPLDEQITLIVQHGSLDKLLTDTIIGQQNPTGINVIVNKVEEIIYDKQLLNHPTLLQAAVNNKLNPNLIHEAINNNDEELILGGLISVGYDVTLLNF